MAIRQHIACSSPEQISPQQAESNQEEWRPIAGFDGYDVSSLGRVRSWRPCRGEPLPRMIGGTLAAGGYIRVRLSLGGSTSRTVFVHRLVLWAFVGPRPEDMVCRHLNGIPGDNRLSNLAWGTREENAADAYRHGTLAPRKPLPPPRSPCKTARTGEDHHFAKLTEDQVMEIRQRRAAGEKRGVLAAEFGVSKTTIYCVEIGRAWRHLPLPATT